MIIVYYKQSHGDHTLFVKHSALEGVIALLVHVDDILVTENDLEERKTLKWCLARSWKTKEFLGNWSDSLKKGNFCLLIKVCSWLIAGHRKNGM